MGGTILLDLYRKRLRETSKKLLGPSIIGQNFHIFLIDFAHSTFSLKIINNIHFHNVLSTIELKI
jgi:hypothetical protein